MRHDKTPIILLLTRITSFHVYVLERYDICMIHAIPALRVTSNHAYVSYRSKTYTWNDVILVKRSMIGVLSCLIQVGMSRGTYAAN